MNISKPQMEALIVLGDGPSTFGPLQDAGSCGRSIASLVGHGLAVKSKNANGSNVWSLTDFGRDVLEGKKKMAKKMGVEL